MVKQGSHGQSIDELRDLAAEKYKERCFAVSKMRKNELIEYLELISSQKSSNLHGKSVKELKELAKEAKKKNCPVIGKMNKKQLEKYVYEGKNLSTRKKKSEIYENICKDLATTKMNEGKIIKKRDEIYKKLKVKIKGKLTSQNFEGKITDDILTEMFVLYDKLFFDNKLKKWSKERNCEWLICWDDGCISDDIAGLCHYLKKDDCLTLKIELSREVFKKSIRILLDTGEGVCINSGLSCTDLLSCIQITFEHEMVHGILGCLCKKYWFGPAKGHVGNWRGKVSSKDGHGKTFMSIVNNLFGHTDYLHRLTWTKGEVKNFNNKENKAKYFKEKIVVGDIIRVMIDGEVISLKVTKKNPKTLLAMKDNTTWKIYYEGIIEVDGKVFDKSLSENPSRLKKNRSILLETKSSPLKECLDDNRMYKGEITKHKRKITRLENKMKKMTQKKK